MRAQPPTYRPGWVLVFASIMLLAGGRSLITGLLKLRDPSAVLLNMGTNTTANSDANVQRNQRLSAARDAAIQPHRNVVKAAAVFQILLALYTLYATAAVLSRDRHGRALTLGVGALGIAYEAATLPIDLSVMHDFSERGADLLAQVAVQSAGADTTATVGEVAARLRSAINGVPIVIAVISVGGFLVLIMFFGGRRGRALYGIDGPPSTRPGG